MTADSSIPETQASAAPELSAAGFQRQLELVWRQTAMTAMLNALAHELNQPLTSITLHCDAALTTARSLPGADPEMIADITQAAAGAYQAGKIVASLRRFMAKPDPPEAPMQLNRLVKVAAQLCELEAGDRHVTIGCRLDPRLPEAMVNGPQIVYLILNLLRQSVAACGEAERTRCAITVSTRSRSGSVEARIAGQNACRLPAFEQQSLLDALQSASPGLDMAICRTIVEAHKGRLWTETAGEQGARIVVALPLEAE